MVESGSMTHEDLQAVADATFDYLKARGFRRDARRPRLRLSPIQGHAHSKTGSVSVPRWALGQGEEYVIYYTVHETCHLFVSDQGHGRLFAMIESDALSQWGLRPVFGPRQVYPQALDRISDGMTVWKEKR